MTEKKLTKAQLKRKRKAKVARVVRRMLGLILLLSLVAMGIYQFFKKPSDLVELSFGTVPITSTHNAVILKDELVVLSMNNGVFTPNVLDGERVKKNQRIGTLEVGASVASVAPVAPAAPAAAPGEAQGQAQTQAQAQTQPQTIAAGLIADGPSRTKAPATPETTTAPNATPSPSPNANGTGDTAPEPAPIAPSPDTVLVDAKTLQGEVDAIYNALVGALKGNRFIEAENMKKELSFKLDRLKRMSEEAGSNAFYLHASRTGQVGSAGAASGQSLAIQASEPGLVSFNVDGMEGRLHYENRYQITFEQIFGTDIVQHNKSQVAAVPQQPIFKIIRPEVWYLACKVELDELPLFQREAKVNVMIGEERVEARVEETFASGNVGVLILRSSQQATALYTKRTLDVTLVRDEVKGLILPKDALVKKNGQDGVYAVDSKKQVIFVPVSIIATRESDYVIYEGHFMVTDDKGQVTQISTVKHGDQVLRSSTTRKEGDILE